MDAYKIIKYPLSTEKTIRMMESENKLGFVVDIDADKPMIKQAIETMFKAKVASVTTHIQNGTKKAIIKFNAETPAIDIATQLGLM